MAGEKGCKALPGLAILSTDCKALSSGPTDVYTLLLRSSCNDSISRTTIEHGSSGRFLLFVAPTLSRTPTTLDKAAEQASRYLTNTDAYSHDSIFESESGTFLTVIVPLSHPLSRDSTSLESGSWITEAGSSSTLFQQWRATVSDSKHFSSKGLRQHARRVSSCGFSFLVILSGAFLLAAVWALYPVKQVNPKWLQYPVGKSDGPKHTALLHPDNVTDWVQNHYNPADWYWRIDEQALVPIELLDEQERRYQDYLAKRYPEKAEMRDSRAWMDPEFLESPNNYFLPTDMEFHRGHCVRAIRRYWQARETGQHVCSWDIDYRHMHHCFSMLEDLIYVPGPRATGRGEVLSMSWRTKVCAWEPLNEITP